MTIDCVLILFEEMKIFFLLTLLTLASSYNHRHIHETSSFQRDSVERVTGYPFKEGTFTRSRTTGDGFPGERRSYYLDYVFGTFGNRNLPLREAVESLPIPPLTGESRSLQKSGRLPLRDAVEHRVVDGGRRNGDSGRRSKGFHFRPENPNPDLDLLYYRNLNLYPLFENVKHPLNNRTLNLLRNNEDEYLNWPTTTVYSPRGENSGLVRSNQLRDFKGSSKPEKKVVCYLQGWANRRKEPMKFSAFNIDPFACTHLVYAYAAIDPHSFTVYPQDEENDVIQGGYRSVVGLKRLNPQLRVLISIAGWSTGDSQFSKMVSSATRRQKFIKSVAKFLDAYKFDGIDLDWEYPGAEDLGGNRSDREHFVLLVEELSEIFALKNWFLSASVAPSRFRIEDGYKVKEMVRYLDLINVLAFDLHSEREDVADHHSPLHRRDHDQGLDIFYNADYAIQYWMKKGAPREKLALTIPFFGRSFTLKDPRKWAPGSEIRGLGREGPFTQDSGFLAYFEICEMLGQGDWTTRVDEAGSPYAVGGDQWIGYDDVLSVRRKANYAKNQGLGGVALYAIDLDDYQGICGTKWPLLYSVKAIFSESSKSFQPQLERMLESPSPSKPPMVGMMIGEPERVNCSHQGFSRDPYDCRVYHLCEWGWKTSFMCEDFLHFDPSVNMCNWPELAGCVSERQLQNYEDIRSRSSGDDVPLPETNHKIVCYFTNWAWYRKSDGKFVPEHIDPRLCTHIVYAYASLDPNELVLKPFDVTADIDNNFFDRVTRIPDLRNSRKKSVVLLAVGGWTDSTGNKYSRLVSDPTARKHFISTTVAFLKKYRFRGLHFDWIYPKCWQSNCNKGPDSDMKDFASLLKELNKEFKKHDPPLILAAGISGYREVIDVAYDVAKISKAVDFMSVMTYDYHGSWEKKTGHVSPLYYRKGDSFPRFNTNYTMEYLTSKGADRSKLVVGIPFYGQTFTLKDEKKNKYGAPTSGPGSPGEFTKQPGMLAFYEICNRVGKKEWTVSRDSYGSTGPFAYKGTQWVSYDDVISVSEKAKYIKSMGFGGAMAWSIDLDDFNNRCCQGPFPLLRALGRVLGQVSEEEPEGIDCTRPMPPVTPPAPVTTTGVDSGGSWEHEHEHGTTAKPTSTESPSSTTTTTSPKPSKKPTTTRRPTTTKKPEPEPPIVEEGPSPPSDNCEPGKYYPDPNNCNAYYRCILGELKKQYCIIGLHWNSEISICDWPESAKCDKENLVDSPPITTSTTTTMLPSTTTTTKPPNEWQPPETIIPTTPESCTNGAYYPVPGVCNLFNICVNGNLVTQSCAQGLYWNQQQQICDWSHNVACKSNINKVGDTIDIDLELLSQPCQEGTYSPYPGNCNQYLMCLWGTYAVFSCPPGLYWNNRERICDWQHRVVCGPGGITEGPGPEEENEIGGGIIEEEEYEEEEEVGEEEEEVGEEEVEEEEVEEEEEVGEEEEEEIGEEEEVGEEEEEENIGEATKPPIVLPPTVIEPPSPPPSKPPSKPSSQSGYFKIVCYFTNWAWYRQGAGKYLPENIDPNLCTHIVYGFAVLDYENLIIKAHDSWADFDNKFYERVVAYKKKGLKVTLAIGGWNDSQGNKYSRLVNNPTYRKKFIVHVIKFLQKYNFDGLDLDWEYPKCWQVDCNKGPDSDKSAFSAFVKELHEAFKPLGLLLSAAVSPSKTVVDAGYDVPALGKYLDWISVMTYDYHGQWDKKTGHVAPLYFHEDDEFYFFNANYSINYWISEGVPRRKIVMGMPLYGQSFQLADPSSNGLNAKAPGPGQAGEFTRAAGFLAYYEICDRIMNRGWKVVEDSAMRMGPYAFKGNQWVSFDDVKIIKKKSEYIRRMDLGGGMIWALDLDDFTNKCGGGKHPLLSTIRNILGPAPDDSDVTQRPGAPSVEATTKPPRPIRPKPPTVTSPRPPPSEEEFKVVCYFTNWAWYRQGLGKFLPSDIDADLCTHIIYGFAVLNGDEGIIKAHDAWADFDNKFYEKVTQFKKKGIKVLIAIGGWNDSAGDKYSRLVNNPSARIKFIAHVIEFIEKHNFDGLDLDWEYPKCWQVNCNMGPDSDKPAFAAFVKELRAAFEPRGLLLSAAVSPSKRVMDAGYDIPALSRYLDWISVMTYDFHGQWDKRTGHVAPMYLHADDVDVTFHANFSINYWISEGADRKKIVMGMPMYGQSFSLANVKENGLNAPSYGGGEAGEFTRARGFLSYYEICHNIREKKWKVVRDYKGRMGPYAYSRDQWVSFDDQEMIKHKAQYIQYMGLGGGMIWALDLDDFKNRCQCESYPLLKTINRILRNYPGPQPVCVLDGKENEIVPERPDFGETPPPSEETTPFPEKPPTQPPVRPPTRPPTKPTAKPPTRPPTKPTVKPPTRPPTKPPAKPPTRPPTKPTAKPPTRPSTTQTPPTEIDTSDCRGQTFAPHPNCNKYYFCIHGKLQEMYCPQGLHWNKDHCDWPANSGCKSSVTTVGFVSSTTRMPSPSWRPTSMPTTTEFIPAEEEEEEENEDEEEEEEVENSEDTVTDSPVVPDSEYKIVCYFTNWAWYRPGIGKYKPENIDYKLCTHIAYGFAVLDPNTLTIKPHDSWADIDNEFYIKVTALKKKGLKVLIAIGGWNDSLGNKYSRLVASSARRRKFIDTVMKFIQKYNFDGLDLDWEYPKCWQVNCDAGPEEDKQNFALFVEELSNAFKPKGLLLSSAVSPSKVVVDMGYEVAKLSRYFDYISVMTYDFHGHWDKKTGHVAPLYYYPGDTYDYFNANFSINYWIEKGADRRKLIMGLPLYGQSFNLQNPNNHGLNVPSTGPGQAGEFTRSGGFLSFYEICEYVKRQGWKVTRDKKGRIGPYAYKGNQWVSYDDVSEVRRKSQFIKNMHLGGGMIWALDLDDFRNRCGCGNHPLLKTLNYELRGIGRRISDCT